MAIKEAATERVKKAAKGRLAGDSPSKFGALLPALIVGIGGAAITYKLLRSQPQAHARGRRSPAASAPTSCGGLRLRRGVRCARAQALAGDRGALPVMVCPPRGLLPLAIDSAGGRRCARPWRRPRRPARRRSTSTARAARSPSATAAGPCWPRRVGTGSGSGRPGRGGARRGSPPGARRAGGRCCSSRPTTRRAPPGGDAETGVVDLAPCPRPRLRPPGRRRGYRLPRSRATSASASGRTPSTSAVARSRTAFRRDRSSPRSTRRSI